MVSALLVIYSWYICIFTNVVNNFTSADVSGQLTKMAKLKGLHNSNYCQVPYPVLVDTIDQHVWATIGKVISPLILPSPPVPSPTPLISLPPSKSKTTESVVSDWKWNVPNLSVDSQFYND